MEVSYIMSKNSNKKKEEERKKYKAKLKTACVLQFKQIPQSEPSASRCPSSLPEQHEAAAQWPSVDRRAPTLTHRPIVHIFNTSQKSSQEGRRSKNHWIICHRVPTESRPVLRKQSLLFGRDNAFSVFRCTRISRTSLSESWRVFFLFQSIGDFVVFKTTKWKPLMKK